ncbi:MAG: sodium/proline symporter [Candidatus Eiseniibacteriota bacterium]|nr:MAG: sodium/proline symporter [Candidatus Eisenbacteria bacterium]
MNVYEQLSHPVALTVFLATLFLPIVVGFFAVRATRSQSDFFLGGRAMNRLVVALSAVSTGRSSWLILGVSGTAYAMGAGAIWAVVGYTVVEFFQFIYVGMRLRTRTQEFGSITLLDYFESRHNDARQTIRITGAVIIGIFITAYVSAQLFAGAKTLSSALDIQLNVCLLLSALLILIYMVLGGYIAVAYNDVIRALVMLLALVVLPVVGLARLGGVAGLQEMLARLNPAYVDPLSLGLGLIIGFVGIGLGSPGQPHILVRYMSIDDPRNLRVGAVIGTAWNVLLGLGAVLVGLLARAAVPEIQNLPNQDAEMAYLVLSSRYFGPALYGLLVGGIFAAILSTADSQLLVVASTFVRDVYEKTLRKGSGIEEWKKLRLSRYVVVLSGALALVLAFLARDLVFWLVLFAWAGLGASLGPAVILSLFWKRTTRWGIVAGMLTGTVVTIVWKLFLREPTGLYELIPAFVCSVLAILVASLLAPDSAPGTGRSTTPAPSRAAPTLLD